MMHVNTYEFVENIPSAEALANLRKLVGWREIDERSMAKGLANSLYAVFVKVEEEVIGTARVVGDSSTCFYIQDVIVKPGCQGLGIGTTMMHKVMDFIGENACTGATIGLMSAKGKEGFYEKFGFRRRPSESFGHGMFQLWIPKKEAAGGEWSRNE
ncbi:MAG: acetyltransferase family protein [Massilibacillus sp.]|jgi:ribosomal protein S18 acetylase RimI-like enzyme|nr:acetyltransferase family protein [Massilibacillus sp.]